MNESATREHKESRGWAILSDREHPAMMRGVASRHDAWRGTLCHVPRHVLATSVGVPLNHATSAVVPRRHAWRGSVHLPRDAWWRVQTA